MKLRGHWLCFVLVIAILTVVVPGCDRLWETPTPEPPPAPEIPQAVLTARDAALGFLREEYPDRAPATGLQWDGSCTSPPSVKSVASFEFTSGDWVMTVWVPTIAQDAVIYEMVLENDPAGFLWTGRLSQSHLVIESNLGVDADVLVVRDLVLGYYRDRYGASAPAEGLVWMGERITPEGSIGHERCRFVADGWVMQVDYDVARPDIVLYTVALESVETGEQWLCQVDAVGEILEIQRSAG